MDVKRMNKDPDFVDILFDKNPCLLTYLLSILSLVGANKANFV